MDKIIPIGVGIVLLIVIVAAFIFYPKASTTTQSTTSILHGSTTTIPPSTIAGTTTIPNTNSTGCVSQNATQSIFNGNFSTGNYTGWNVTGVGFGPVPFNITSADQNGAYYGQPWTGWNGTFFATSYTGGTTVAKGNITTEPFLLTEPYINFKIISPQNGALYVQILSKGKVAVTVHYNTHTVPLVNTTNTTTSFDSLSNFFNASIVVAPLLCKQVQVRVVAGLVGTQGNKFNYIAATNFYMSKQPVATPGIIVNQTSSFT